MTNQFNDAKMYADIHMKKCIGSFKEHINKIHIGRVSPNMLDAIQVEYYGTVTSLSKITHSIVENSRTLAITVFDNRAIKLVEKAILISKLGLVPIVYNNIIRVKLPPLTEERRRALMKMVRSEAEKSKISIRNIRRIMNDKIKFLLKNKELNIDKEHSLQNEIQKLTNSWIKEIDSILAKKELELMKF